MKLPKFFKPAIKALKKADHHTFKIGAAVFYKKYLISIGSNSVFKTHPLMRQYDEHKTIHAEVAAIIQAAKYRDLSNCHLVVYRELKNGNPALARPCEVCQAIMHSFGIKEVYYTTDKGWAREFFE